LPVVLGAGSIDLISQTSDNLNLVFTLPEYQLKDENVKGQSFVRIVMDEGMPTSDEGYPELRMFSIPIAIPVDGSAIARVTAVSSDTQRSVALRPVPTLLLNGEDREYEMHRNNAAFSRSTLYPESILEISEPAFVGDRRFVSLRIYPFQYSASRQELIIHTRLEIAVTILGNKSASVDWQMGKSPVDAAADAFFINNATSKTWRLPRKADYSHTNQKSVAGEISELQLIVDTEGIYKVTYAELKAFITERSELLGQEMSWNIDQIDPRRLELQDEFGQIPIHFHGEEDGSFDPGDYFEFFGDRHYGDDYYYDDFTAENVYTLRLMDRYGARMVVENGGLVVSDLSKFYMADAYRETVHFEQQLVSDKLGRGWTTGNQQFYREDVWFWKKINAPNLEIVPIELQYPIESSIRKASARFVLQGLTYKEDLAEGEYDHEATIRLNSAMVNTHTWIGQTEQVFENQAEIPNSFLRHG
ncbi:MAG TPA: C25 family peptidase propeptide domain-containing protein, partial [Candidatus Cloacimonadota bacterium]|nr:C25 family peptidase propeptide domain-containing protein [Candidatus Cloacimonadota bacterium]